MRENVKGVYYKVMICTTIGTFLFLIILGLYGSLEYMKIKNISNVAISSEFVKYRSFLSTSEEKNESEIEVLTKEYSENNSSNSNNNIKSEENDTKNNYSKDVNSNANNSVNIIESYYGKITGYGSDCYGCTSLMTASGHDLSGGNIYYNDSLYGNIRIVAGDASYPFGTIVRIECKIGNIIAIVLDRGGSIGKGKIAQFDLLFESEEESSVLGLSDAKFEILRMGY